jgi:hypothetical protein
MKTTVSVIAALAIASASLIPNAHAGDREWATAGKVMAGVGAGLLLAKAFEPAPTVVHTTTYVPAHQVVVSQPAPVQYVIHNAPVVPPAPVMVSQPSYVVVQRPVYYQPAPVYVAPAPVYCPPARPIFVPPVFHRPAVSFHVSLGHGHHHSHHRSYGHGHHGGHGHGGHGGGHGHGGHGGRR